MRAHQNVFGIDWSCRSDQRVSSQETLTFSLKPPHPQRCLAATWCSGSFSPRRYTPLIEASLDSGYYPLRRRCFETVPRVGQRRSTGETRSNGVIAREILKSAISACLTAGALKRGRVEPPTGTGNPRDAPHVANGCGLGYPPLMQFTGAEHRMRSHSRNTTQGHLPKDVSCPPACRATSVHS
jgi:hypothetical protein